jgi:hypothetical protein
LKGECYKVSRSKCGNFLLSGSLRTIACESRFPFQRNNAQSSLSYIHTFKIVDERQGLTDPTTARNTTEDQDDRSARHLPIRRPGQEEIALTGAEIDGDGADELRMSIVSSNGHDDRQYEIGKMTSFRHGFHGQCPQQDLWKEVTTVLRYEN